MVSLVNIGILTQRQPLSLDLNSLGGLTKYMFLHGVLASPEIVHGVKQYCTFSKTKM